MKQYGAEGALRLLGAIEGAEAIVVDAVSGLSTAAGFVYDGERFCRYFADFIEKHGFTDIYSAGFYPFETPRSVGRTGAAISGAINRFAEASKGLFV